MVSEYLGRQGKFEDVYRDDNARPFIIQTLKSLCAMLQVEGEAQGEESVLQQFFKDVDKGPSHAKVAHVTKEDRNIIEGETGFEVRR